MNRKFKNFIFGLVVRKMSVAAERTFWLIMELAVQFKLLMVTILVLGIVVGMLEGISLGSLATAVFVITSESDTCLDPLEKFGAIFNIEICEIYSNHQIFLYLLVIAVIGQIAKSLIQYGLSIVGVQLQAKVSMQLQSKIVLRLLRLDYKLVNSFTPGEKQNLLSNANGAVKFLSIMNQALVATTVFIAYLSILIYSNWKLTVVTGVGFLGILIVIFPLLNRLKIIGRKVRMKSIQLSTQTIEYLQAMRLVRLYGRTDFVLGFIQKTIWETVRLKREATLWGAPIAPAQEIIIIVMAVLILFVGYSTSGSARESLPPLLAYILVLNRCGNRLSTINTIRSTIAKHLPALEHASDFLETSKGQLARDSGPEINDNWESINLTNVGFKYNSKSENVVENIDLRIARGEKVAFVGPSGAGKSTLIDLIAGLYEPDEGSISLGGLSSAEALPTSWHHLFSVVSQNDLILNTTVKENLLFANPDAKQVDIENACKIADAHDFITKMSQGYNTVLGERGSKVSGGQVQRLAFARAILKNSPILVLDEATSALDVLTEQRITNALIELDERKTILIVAHRLSTIMSADRIVVLDEGRIVEVGSHSQLLSLGGLYSEMWNTMSLVDDTLA